jgi:photosystem II stability/assembly factor-like uncharacterized protein
MSAGVNAWTPSGLSRPNVDRIDVDPRSSDRVLAVANGLLFRSGDAGQSWQPVLIEGRGLSVSSLDRARTSPDILFVSGVDGVYRSADGGATWEWRGIAGWSVINQVAVHPTRPETVYAHNGDHAFRSNDGGENWEEIHGPWRPGAPVVTLALDPSMPDLLYVGVFFDAGIYRSFDGGGHWNQVGLGLADATALLFDSNVPGVAYALGRGRVFKSIDRGNLWFAISPANVQTQAAALDPTESSVLYIGTLNGVLKTTDSGVSWFPAGSGFSPIGRDVPITSVTVSASEASVVYVGGVGEGLFRSESAGGSWERRNSGFPNLPVQSVAVDSQPTPTVYAGGKYGEFLNLPFRLFRRDTTGWTEVGIRESQLPGALPLPMLPIVVDPKSPATVYAGAAGCGEGPCAGSLFKTADRGGSWAALSPPGGAILSIGIDPHGSAVLAGLGTAIPIPHPPRGYEGTVVRSADGGDSWSTVDFPVSDDWTVALAFDAAHPGVLFAGTLYRGVFKSVDGGVSWSGPGTGLANNVALNSLAIDPVTGTTLYASAYWGVFRSTDSGATWTPTSLGVPTSAVVLDPTDAAIAYAAAAKSYDVYRTADGGAHWRPMSVSLPQGLVRSLTFDPSNRRIYAATDSGVFEYEDRPRTTHVATERPATAP